MICMLFTMAACSGNQEENKDLSAKKTELEKLTKERDAIAAKITALEEEIKKIEHEALTDFFSGKKEQSDLLTFDKFGISSLF